MTDSPTSIEFYEVTDLLKAHHISAGPDLKYGMRMVVNLNTPLLFSFARNGGRLDLVSICEFDNPETFLTFDEFKDRLSAQTEDRGYLQ